MFHVPHLVSYKATRAAENWEHFIPVSCSSRAASDYNRLTRSLNFNCCLSGLRQLRHCEAQIHYEIVRAVHRCMHQPRGATTLFSSRGNTLLWQFLLIFALFCHQIEAVCPKASFLIWRMLGRKICRPWTESNYLRTAAWSPGSLHPLL